MGDLTPSKSQCTIKVPARCQYIFIRYGTWDEGNKRHPQAHNHVIIFSCNNKDISPTYIIHVGRGHIFFISTVQEKSVTSGARGGIIYRAFLHTRTVKKYKNVISLQRRMSIKRHRK